MKTFTLSSLLILTAMFSKAQPIASGGLGLYMVTTGEYGSGISGDFNIGYRFPFSDCRPHSLKEGLIVTGGFIRCDGGLFNLKAGKALRLDGFSELEIMAGWGWKLVSTDDRSKNSKAAIYSASWVKTHGIGAWIISATKYGSTYTGNIGMRVYFY